MTSGLLQLWILLYTKQSTNFTDAIAPEGSDKYEQNNQQLFRQMGHDSVPQLIDHTLAA